MKHWVKASINTVLAALAIWAKELTNPFHRYAVYAVSLAGLFVNTLWDLKPDARMNKVRKYHVDAALRGVFAEARQRVQPGQRLPFRANLMVSRRAWYGWPVLRMVYRFEVMPTDADYGLKWPWKRGLCWDVLRTGDRAFWDGNPDAARKYRLTRRQRERTRRVKAVLSLPVRSAHEKEGAPLADKVVAVLNVDALTDDAARELQSHWLRMEQDNAHRFLEVAEMAGLYF